MGKNSSSPLVILFFFLTCVFQLESLTLEEKVGQLFMAYFDGENANEHAERLIRETKIGGIIYYNFSNDLTNSLQVQQLSRDLQDLAREYVGIPLLIAVDQEGGLVARLQNGFTEFPGNAALGRTNQPQLAYEASYIMGKELQLVGVNFNLAPVVDVNNNPKNPVIGIRSFSDDKEIVANFANASIQGFKQAGVIPCLKHFPGHGDVSVDSHKSLPVVNKSLAEIDKLELYPYKKLACEAPVIMTAHVLYPQLDPINCATLSPQILQGILREKLQFDGVIITDSLTMQGVAEGQESLDEVAIKAFEAGNDILLIGGRDLQHQVDGETNINEIIPVYHSLVNAVKSGRISEKRVDASVARILKLKGIHTSLAQNIASRSIHIEKWDLDEDLSKLNIAIIAPEIIHPKIEKTDLMTLGKTTTLSDKDYQNADYVIFCSYNAWKDPNQLELLKTISKEKPTACIALRDPYDLDANHQSKIKISTYSPTSCSLQVVANWLKGLQISDDQANTLGQKIWHNECRNRIDQLTFWSEKEPFPSMGIGHFIWPPKNYEGVFSDGRFQDVLEYMQTQNIKIPDWLIDTKFSPWSTREAFYEDFHSEKMQELRAFLLESVPYQTKYLVERLNKAFNEIVIAAPKGKKGHIINQFHRVGKSPYILVDYLNFKGAGTNPKERYRGKGWGLLQVLEEMNEHGSAEKEFVATAKKLLQERVSNSPDLQKEKQWLPGWINRLKTYEN